MVYQISTRWKSAGVAPNHSQRGAVGLAEVIARHGRDLEDPLRALVPSQDHPRVCYQPILVETAPGTDRHPGGHLLAPPRVRDSGHHGLGHRRMALQCDLDLAGVDVQSAGDDEFLYPAANDQVPAGLIDAADVAGAEPAVLGEGRLGRGRVTPVAAEDLGTAQLDLAVRPIMRLVPG